jgi:hypothetical protein
MTYIGKEPLPVFIGGTGVASTTAYAPLCGGTTTTGNLQAASTGISNSGYVLTSNGASALPSWAAPSNVGTVTQYDVLVGGASSAIASIGPGSAGQVLQSGGASANPAYSTATYPAVATGTGTILRANGTNWVATTATYPTTTTANQLLYSSSTSVIGEITGANNGVLITSNSGVPSLLANSATPGYVLTANSGAPPSWQAAASSLTGFTDGSSDYNTALGVGAAVATVGGGGVQNVALGYNTLHANTSGNHNIAVGYLALAASITLSDNIAMGAAALTLLTTGAGNIGIGTGTLSSITSGSYNIGIGLANSKLTSGSSNIAIGYAAYSGSTPTGSQNVLIGTSAGNAYTSSESNNICLGYNVNGTASESNVIRIGNNSAAACFINGIEGVSVANTNMVTINTSTGQLGSQAVPASLTGYTDGSSDYNTALGVGTASSSSGTNNVSIGYQAFNGGGSGYHDNVAVGYQALFAGGNNQINTAIGSLALSQNSAGYANTAVGHQALYTYTSGNYNNAFGNQSGYGGVSGSRNVFFGTGTGTSYTGSESSNTLIGQNVGGIQGENHAIHIGDAGGGDVSTTCYIGAIAGVTVISTAAVLVNTSTNQLGTVISSERYKDNIKDISSERSEVIYKLRPVEFTYKQNPEFGIQTGLIAEEVQKVAPQLVALDKEGLPCSVSYHELPTLLLAEIQKLNKRIEQLEKNQRN